jgi:hypothetical protein
MKHETVRSLPRMTRQCCGGELTRCIVKAYGELPSDAKINETDFGEDGEDIGFEFGEEEEVDVDDI